MLHKKPSLFAKKTLPSFQALSSQLSTRNKIKAFSDNNTSTNGSTLSKTFYTKPLYTPLSKREKINTIKQNESESTERLKKYSFLFNEIKQQIITINEQINNSPKQKKKGKHVLRGSLFNLPCPELIIDEEDNDVDLEVADEDTHCITINQSQYQGSPLLEKRKLKLSYPSNFLTIENTKTYK